MTVPGRTPLSVIVVILAVAGIAFGQPADSLVTFAVTVEETKGHLVVSQELYATGQRGRAALHAAHPVQEIGNRLIGPIRRVDPALADSVRAALKAPGRDLDQNVPATRYTETVASTLARLDTARDRVVPPARSADLGLQARVLGGLMRALVREYEEGVKDGRVTQVVEYQDAYGFFTRTQVLARAFGPAARATNQPAAQRLDETILSALRALGG